MSAFDISPITLRAIVGDDAEAIKAMNAPDSTGPWNSFDDPLEEHINGATYDGGARVVIEGSTTVGTVSYIKVPYGPNKKSLAFKIGVVILPDYRGRGIGSRAHALLADELFATSDLNRVEADTDVENIPEQRALEKAGFTREGILRGAQWRNGAWHDQVVYSRLREE